MNEENLQAALDAIHEEAVKLLFLPLKADAAAVVELIVSIARHGFDVRGEKS